MAFVHPDRARNLGDARAQDDCGFSVKARTEGSTPAQGRSRKRKWDNAPEEHYSMVGGGIRLPDRHIKTTGNEPGNSRLGPAQGPGKKAKLDHTRVTRPSTSDADRSKRPGTEAPGPPKRNDARRPSNKEPGRRIGETDKLEKARQLAPKYPDLRDAEAWRRLGQITERNSQAEHTFVYRQLRFSQCPRGLAIKEWRIRVHREMEGLGLEDAYKGPHIRKVPRDEAQAEAVVEAVKEIARAEEVKKERMEMERLIADDGFDIDIYGDEETQRKYEPWIRSRMDRG
jgi:hypothetical protein